MEKFRIEVDYSEVKDSGCIGFVEFVEGYEKAKWLADFYKLTYGNSIIEQIGGLNDGR